MAQKKNITLKQMKKRILKLKSSMVKNLSSITNAISKMIVNVNSVLNTLTDEDYLRNLSIGIETEPQTSAVYYDTSSQNRIFSAYVNIPKDFFDMGENYAESFSDGFLSVISGLTDNVTSVLSSSSYRESGGNTENITYNSSYNFYSSGLTVSQQLKQARNEELLKQLRA